MNLTRTPIEGGIAPLDPITIEAHLRLSGDSITSWEYKTLMTMDLIYRSTKYELMK